MKFDYDIEELVEQAEEIQQCAHAPYSEFRVGAALLTSDGTVYTACNVEAKPTTNTLHAEARAVAKAVEGGHCDFEMLALITDSSELLPPCGNCRQSLATFQKDLLIIVSDGENKKAYELDDLLPEAYVDRKMNRS